MVIKNKITFDEHLEMSNHYVVHLKWIWYCRSIIPQLKKYEHISAHERGSDAHFTDANMPTEDQGEGNGCEKALCSIKDEKICCYQVWSFVLFPQHQ